MNDVSKRNAGGPPSREFRLDKANAKLMGVCGGIANYTGIDPMLVRVGFFIGGLISLGTAGVIYIGIGLIAD